MYRVFLNNSHFRLSNRDSQERVLLPMQVWEEVEEEEEEL
jgi:hypothetical protein